MFDLIIRPIYYFSSVVCLSRVKRDYIFFLTFLFFMFLFCSKQYADPVADLLDRWGVFRCRLFRESCVFHRGNYVKDLNKLGRDLHKVVIVDNSPASYTFHPDNAVSIPLVFLITPFFLGSINPYLNIYHS
jgi:hypothetical protein